MGVKIFKGYCSRVAMASRWSTNAMNINFCGLAVLMPQYPLDGELWTAREVVVSRLLKDFERRGLTIQSRNCIQLVILKLPLSTHYPVLPHSFEESECVNDFETPVLRN
jgi:hypothetical protein